MSKQMKTKVCVAGAGPAGMILSLLLAQAGGDVVLAERHTDFTREFRGEFLQPGVLNVLKEFGILDETLARGEKITKYQIVDHGEVVLRYDFSELGKDKTVFGVNVSQSYVLPILLEKCQRYPNFTYLGGYAATELLTDADKVTGVVVKSGNEEIQVISDLVVGADGRTSTINKLANLPADEHLFEMDVLWIKFPKPANWEDKIELRIHDDGYLVLMPSYEGKIQLGINMPKGGLEEIKKTDINATIKMLTKVIPEAANEIRATLKLWNDFTPLPVSGGLATDWCVDGLIVIGDAAHTVGPIAGQGINQGIKDAITLFNIICDLPADELYKKENLEKLQKIRYEEVAALHQLQSRQEKLLNANGDEGKRLRKETYSALTQKDQRDSMANVITMQDLSIHR